MGRYCPHCGAEIENSNKFCMNCGKNVLIQSSAPTQAYNTQSTTPNYYQQNYKPKKDNKLLIAIISIVAIVIILFVVMLLLMGGDETKFYGKWTVDNQGNPYAFGNYSFYENGSVLIRGKQFNPTGTQYKFQWENWWLESGRLYLTDSTNADESTNHRYRFSNSNKRLEIYSEFDDSQIDFILTK